MDALQAGGVKNALCNKVAGWVGIWVALVAFYCATAILTGEVWDYVSPRPSRQSSATSLLNAHFSLARPVAHHAQRPSNHTLQIVANVIPFQGPKGHLREGGRCSAYNCCFHGSVFGVYGVGRICASWMLGGDLIVCWSPQEYLPLGHVKRTAPPAKVKADAAPTTAERCAPTVNQLYCRRLPYSFLVPCDESVPAVNTTCSCRTFGPKHVTLPRSDDTSKPGYIATSHPTSVLMQLV